MVSVICPTGPRENESVKAQFIEPMLLQRTSKLPEGDGWRYEIKWDGYRAIAIRTGGKVSLRSRNDNDFSVRYAGVAAALAKLPDDTIVDGEIVALDAAGKPSFNVLQNYGPARAPVFFYVFDVLMIRGKSLMNEHLSVRQEILSGSIMPKLADPVRYAGSLDATLDVLVRSVKEQGLEGLVAKRLDSTYEPGQRSGAWMKMRLNQRQEFVIGGYTVGGRTFDALIFGYYEGKNLRFASKTRNGFTPPLREALMRKFKGLEQVDCPFVNLPEKRAGRWGQGITAETMKECRWLQPILVAQFEFVEWTPDDHLRHSSFISLRTDKNATDVVRE
jgi:DNA ligase D-like protein (predicted ligase)